MAPLLTTVRLVGGATVDVAVECDPAATVGAVAGSVATALGQQPPDNPTFHLVAEQRSLPSDLELASAPIRHGELVEIVSAAGTETGETPAAILQVVAGPLRGTTLPVPSGQSTLGRSSRNEVVLRDEAVSASHARITVADRVVIEDLGSTNGTVINGGEPIFRPTMVDDDDTITIGENDLQIRVPPVRAGGEERYIRSPRRVPPLEPREFPVTTPPREAPKRRIPMVTSLAPLAIAGVTYVISGNLASLLLALLSPVIAVVSRLETRMINRSQLGAATGRWRESLAAAVAALDDAQAEELDRRHLLYPEVRELAVKAEARLPILWSRTPGHDDFLALRIGRGEVESVHSLEVPQSESNVELLAEAAAAQRERSRLHDAPVLIPLDQVGTVGLVGPVDEGVSERSASPQMLTARSMILQAAMLHSPSDLAIFAITPEAELEQWDWLKWLPHARAGTSIRVTGEAGAPAMLADLAELIERRLAAMSGGGAERPKPVPRMLLVVSEAAGVPRPRIASILKRGPAAGVATCWIGSTRARLPDACRAIVEHDRSGIASLEVVPTGATLDGIAVEGIGTGDTDEVARSMAPLVDAAAGEGAQSIPNRVRLHELLEDEAILDDADAVAAHWSRSSSLAAPVGASADGPFRLDLRVDGPHGLVAGTTGSGKSELLQSLIASLAVAHPPNRINFLLVDYKGGAAFREASQLPHTVGFVTDLDEHLVRRSLTSLRAELTRREQLLNSAAAKDLAAMEEAGHPDTPPSLLIVVDEFAALVNEVPDFVDGVVDIAQRGRSLGLHLLLATQRPAGVVTEYIRANTNLRIALRVASDDESNDVIGARDAAAISRSTPGRAIARIGPTELIPFQSAFVGARDEATIDPARSTTVARFSTAGLQQLLAPEVDETGERGPTDLHRLVGTVHAAHTATGRPDPRRPWLPPIEQLYDLASLEPSTDAARLTVGLADLPEEQAQHPAVVDLTAGHLLVLGASRAGKTMALRTMAVAAQIQDVEPVWVYGLDAAGRGLRMTQSLPIVGGVVESDDHERVTRLIRTLRTLIDDRVQRMSAAGAQDLAELRQNPGDPVPRVLMLVDGLHGFMADYETVDGGRWTDSLGELMADGLAAGVHFAVATDRRSGIPTRFLSQLPQLLCFRLASDDDYLTLGLPRGSLTPDTPPGRGFLNGREVQVAIPGGEVSGDGQMDAFDALGRRSAAAVEPLPIRTLPEMVAIGEVSPSEAGPTIGIADADLGPAVLDTSTGLIGVFGGRGTGRTTALLTIGDALRRYNPEMRTLLVSRTTPSPPAFGSWTRTAGHPDEVEALIAELTEKADAATRFAVLVDDYTDHLEGTFDATLARLIPATRTAPVLIVVSGEASAARSAYSSEVLTAVKRAKSGVLLMPDMTIDGDTLGASLPRARIRFVRGRGFNVTRGSAELIQVAVPST